MQPGEGMGDDVAPWFIPISCWLGSAGVGTSRGGSFFRVTNSVDAQNLGTRHVDYFGRADVFRLVIVEVVAPLESNAASGEGKDLIHFVSGSESRPVSSAAAVPAANAAGNCPIFRDKGSKDGHSTPKVNRGIF